VGLHDKHLPTSTVVHDFEQRTRSGANGASDALSMGPTLNSLITVLCILTVSIGMSYLHVVAFVSDIHMHIYVVVNLLMFYFWIKLTMKMPNFLTIQKLNVRQFSISGFVVALKPNIFDGKNFMIWRAKMELWLTAMHSYHAA
jgi:hypothetical protein